MSAREQGDDAHGKLLAHCRDLTADSWAKTWWHLDRKNPLIAQAFKADTTEPDTWYALWPFRYMQRGEHHLILAAYPAPALDDDDWLGITHVIAWEPRTGAVEVLGDDRPQLVGHFGEGSETVYADPRAFFTAWAAARSRWMAMRRNCAVHRPAEPDTMPGALVVGDIDRVSWPVYQMPARFRTVGADPRAVNRAIFNFVHLPQAVGSGNGQHV